MPPSITPSLFRFASAALLLPLLSAILLAEPATATDRSAIESAVVKLSVFTSPPDPNSPWQKANVEPVGGSGVIIDGNRILTNAHVVEDYASLEVKRAGQAKRYPAEVSFFGHQCDLALVAVEDQRFFEGATPLPLGSLPEIQSQVDVYGFPIGGDTVSVTSGIVSRVEIDRYTHSREFLLIAQIDAPINPGNSGGPAITDGKIAGLAVQSMGDAENIGYIVPAPVIAHFLEDVADGQVDGFPRLGVDGQALESDAHRRALGMAEEETGILTKRVEAGGSAWGLIQPGDVALEMDGLPIANDGTIPWPGIGRVRVGQLPRSKHVGDTLTVRLLRNGERLQETVTLRSTPRLVPGRQTQDPPSYLIFGGLVFRPLTWLYLAQRKEPSADLLNHLHFQNITTPECRQILVISRVLPNSVNRGYQHMADYIVETVNGVVPRDMAHLAELLDATQEPWLRIVTEEKTFVTLDTQQARAALPAILQAYGIARDRSPDLGEKPATGALADQPPAKR